MTQPAVEVFVRSYADMGHCPVHDPRTDELLWVDVTGGILHRTSLSDGKDQTVAVETMLSAVLPRASGGYAAAVADGFATIDGAGELSLVYRELPEPERRMDFARCDPRGRLWAGSTTLGFATGCGALHRWDGGHDRSVVREDLTLPNGFDWSPAGPFFYLVDSMAGRLFVSVFDMDAGVPAHPRLVAQFGASDGLPYGMCVDNEGCVWLPMWGTGQLRRYAPDGRRLATITLPVSQPSSCGFGPDTTLYVTSARYGLPMEGLAAEPLAGSVFAMDVGVGGPPTTPFAG